MNNRGIALVIVLTVVLALALIATPFVLSMIMQERTATAYKNVEKAKYANLGVKNFAVAWLLPGNEYSERRFPGGIFTTPFHDIRDEFRPLINDGRITSELTITDGKGTIWGITVQDEQGKINLRSAPPALIDRIKTMVDQRIVSIKDFTTVYSGREKQWIYPQRVRGIGSITGAGGAVVNGIGVDSSVHFGEKTRVRVTKKGLPAIETTVSINHLLTSGVHAFDTANPVGAQYLGGVVEVEWRHPINVNTARRQVLVSMMEGLTVMNQGSSVTVDRNMADQMAREIMNSPIATRTDFITLVANSSLGTGEKTAILLNAFDPGNVSLLGTGTMPMTFRSPHSTVTIEANASVNNPSGVQVAGRGFREVVRYSPPATIDRRWECQLDFDRWLQWGTLYQTQLYGFPYGNKALTAPNILPAEGDTTFRPDQSPGAEAWVQSAAARDYRGTAQYINTREHYNSTLEGLEVKGTTVDWSWDQVFSPMPNKANNPVDQMPDVAAGGCEFWVKFNTGNARESLIDIREGDYESRITVEYDATSNPPGIIYSVSDATIGTSTNPIDNGLARIIFPFQPQTDTWYHLGTFWKGTKYAHLALLIDGFSHPQALFDHVDEAGNSILTELRAAIGPTDTTITLADDSFLPNGPSPIQVGQEVIIYDKSTGTHVRGARGTTAAAHPANAKAQIFGYSSKVRRATVTSTVAGMPSLTYDRITTGGGTTAYAFGQNPAATVNGNQTDPMTGQTFIDAMQADIPVTTADITQFPDKGYITIEQEVIYYDAIDPAGPSFTGCSRGEHGTVAAQHNTGRPVRLWSVGVDTYGPTQGSDDSYLSPTIIQIDNEWIGPVQKDPVRTGFWISFVNGTAPIPLLRGTLGTGAQDHGVGANVLPTFVGHDRDRNLARENCGPADVVTLINSDNSKTQMTVLLARPFSGPLSVNTGGGSQLIGFDANVSRPHVADDLHVRVLKFPSGELLSLLWLQNNSPNFTVGPFDATLDEVKFWASPKGNFLCNTQMAASGGTSLDMNNAGGMSNNGGAVKIGDEIIGYAQKRANTLDPITRGYLNTVQQVHDQGDYAFNMSFLPISALNQAISGTDSTFPMTQRLTGTNQYRDGYVLVEQEVMLFNNVQNNWRDLWMPRTFDDSAGLYRGRFGTQAATHKQYSLVYGLPWRYYDTYAAGEFDNTMAYWQTSCRVPDAFWQRFTWEESVSQGDKNMELHAMVRIDGKGEFWDTPGSAGFLLYDFTDNTRPNRINQIGHIRQPGQFDVRFYTEYLQGSFWPADTWKRTFRLYDVRVEYDRATQSLHHEER